MVVHRRAAAGRAGALAIVVDKEPDERPNDQPPEHWLVTQAESRSGTLGGFAKTTEIKPIWAGDVSPALGETLAPSKIAIAERPIVEVFHGTKHVSVKSQ